MRSHRVSYAVVEWPELGGQKALWFALVGLKEILPRFRRPYRTRFDFSVGLTRQWNWRAIVGGPSGTNSKQNSNGIQNKNRIKNKSKSKSKSKIKGDGQECPSHMSLATED